MAKTYAKDEVINFGKFLLDHGGGKAKKKQKGPFITRDYYNGSLAYESPLTGRKIDSRAERQKEMKQHNVREIDPSEGPHRDGSRFDRKDWARRRGYSGGELDD